jgi:peptide/nickel transport system substrate-binding protein
MKTDSDRLSRGLGKKVSRRDVLRTATRTGVGVAGAALVGWPGSMSRGTAAAQSSGPSPAAARTGKRGGRLHVYGAAAVPNLDPTISGHSIQTHFRISLVYNRLMRMVPTGNGLKMEIVPDLAESYRMAPDGLTWTFYLRKGVKWANVPPMKGREVTSDDVLYTFQRGRSEIASDAARYEMIAAVEAVDKHTVRFKLKHVDATFLFNMAGEPSWIIPREVVDQKKDLKNWGAGTGPFIMTKWEPSTGGWYDRNPDSYQAGDVSIDGIDYLLILDKAAAISAFRAGQLDVLGAPCMHVLTKSDKNAIVKSNPGVEVRDFSYNGLAAGLVFKAGVKPFDDLRVRQAVNHAIDRDAVIAAMAEGEGVYTGTYPHKVYADFAFSQDELRQYQRFDPKLSKRLLAEAGYPNGFTTKILWRTDYRQVLDIVMAMLKDVGIILDTQAEAVDYPAWSSRVYIGGYSQMAQFAYTLGNIFHYVHGLHHSQGNRNGARTKLPDIDAKIERSMRTLDKAQQVKLVKEVEKWALTEGLYIIPLYCDTRFAILQPWLQNYNAGLGEMAGVYAADYMAWARINK